MTGTSAAGFAVNMKRPTNCARQRELFVLSPSCADRLISFFHDPIRGLG